ncbi:MAG: DUF4926 domain-containing protein [Planctomycetaceae bacterium]
MQASTFERVALKQNVDGHWLRAGDVAYLVDYVPHPSGGERGCVLEVFNAVGESIATVTVPESSVEPLEADEVLSVRRLKAS